MTSNQKAPELRSVSLRLHVSTRTVTWAVVYRTTRGEAVFDRRVSSGVLPHCDPLVGPQGVIAALESAVAALKDRHGIPAPEASPGAPGGDGGRLTRSQ